MVRQTENEEGPNYVLDIVDGLLSRFQSALAAYQSYSDSSMKAAAGPAKAAIQAEVKNITQIVTLAHADMALMHELILRYRDEGWSAKERAVVARSTILEVLQPDCFDDRYHQDPAFVRDIHFEAKKVRHLYPWFIAPTPPAWDRVEQAAEPVDQTETDKAASMLLELDHADPEYMREVQQILSFMMPIHARWTKERLGADFRTVANMLAEGRDPVVQMLPRWVIDCMIIRYLRNKTPVQLLKLAESAKAVAADKEGDRLIPISEEEAGVSLNLMRKAMSQGDRPAMRMARIANGYAHMGDLSSAIAIYDATIKGTEGTQPAWIEASLAKASMMQRHGMEGLSVIEDLIVKAKAKQRPDHIAASIASYIVNLQLANRGDEARPWLDQMRDVVYNARDDVRVWQHFADYLAACRALGRKDMAINILDIGTSSKADRQAMRPLWADMGMERQHLVKRLWQDANKGSPPKGKHSRPSPNSHHAPRHAHHGHAPPHRRR